MAKVIACLIPTKVIIDDTEDEQIDAEIKELAGEFRYHESRMKKPKKPKKPV